MGDLAGDASGPVDQETLHAIEADVDAAMRILSDLGAEPSLEEQSVERLAVYVEDARHDMDEKNKRRLVDMAGSFLGAAMIARAGGRWVRLAGGELALEFEGGQRALPFNKAHKQVFDGPADNIFTFYRLLPGLLDGSVTRRGGGAR